MVEIKKTEDGLMEVVRDPPFYWDRELKPISLKRWAELFGDWNYRFLCEDTVQVPGTGEVVAIIYTIWVGHDLLVSRDEICVFESMVSDSKGSRYFPHLNETEARTFHEAELKRQQARAAEIAQARPARRV